MSHGEIHRPILSSSASPALHHPRSLKSRAHTDAGRNPASGVLKARRQRAEGFARCAACQCGPGAGRRALEGDLRVAHDAADRASGGV